MDGKGRTYWSSLRGEVKVVQVSRENAAANTGTVAVSAAVAMSVACTLFVPYGYVWPALAMAALAGASYQGRRPGRERMSPDVNTRKRRSRRRVYTS